MQFGCNCFERNEYNSKKNLLFVRNHQSSIFFRRDFFQAFLSLAFTTNERLVLCCLPSHIFHYFECIMVILIGVVLIIVSAWKTLMCFVTVSERYLIFHVFSFSETVKNVQTYILTVFWAQ